VNQNRHKELFTKLDIIAAYLINSTIEEARFSLLGKYTDSHPPSRNYIHGDHQDVKRRCCQRNVHILTNMAAKNIQDYG
jgi:hypothetical protein